jgi:hypothetical protein
MRSLSSAVQTFLVWILVSVLAIALVQASPQLALLLALLGGMAMGVSSVSGCSRLRHYGAEERSGSGGQE